MVALAVAQVPAPRGADTHIEAQQALRKEAAIIRQKETARLEALAAQLRKDGKTAEAATVESRIEPVPPRDGPMRFVPFPEVAKAGAKDFPELQKIRSDSARALFDLAMRAAASELDALALTDASLRGVLQRESDHAEARRLLGFVKYNGGWATPHAAQSLKDKKVLDPTFGWVKEDWLPHLEQGELPDFIQPGRPVRWLPAAEADALRARDWDKNKAWQITTDHFFIRTNVPLSEAIAFGRRLEDLYSAVFSVLADVIGREALPLARRIREPKTWATVTSKKHEVWYFASKAEYVNYFKTQFGREEDGSLGYYMPASEAKHFRGEAPRSYFYRDPGNPISGNETLFHEASHQVLFESAGPTNFGRNRGNFWVWEGLGTYFETFVQQPDGSYHLGGIIGARMEKARHDIVVQKQLVPTAELVALSQKDFLAEPGVYLNYAEAMAFAVFLMQYDDGRYRERFLDYVESAYKGRLQSDVTGKALSDRLKVPYKALDTQFTQFLSSEPRLQALK
jgi:hypothetical protein